MCVCVCGDRAFDDDDDDAGGGKKRKREKSLGVCKKGKGRGMEGGCFTRVRARRGTMISELDG